MMQKNNFKSVPVYDSGNSLYQRRPLKSSGGGPVSDSERKFNRYSSEEYSRVDYSKDRIYDRPAKACDSGDTFDKNCRSGSDINPESPEDTRMFNRYQSRLPSTHSRKSPQKSKYSTVGRVSAPKHFENYQRSSAVGFKEDYQQYSSESDANSNEYYPKRSKTQSEREQRLTYQRMDDTNDEDLMDSEKTWNHRPSERDVGESCERNSSEDEKKNCVQRSSGLDSDLECARNPSPPLLEDYEENYLDMQMVNERDEHFTRQNSEEYNKELQNPTKVEKNTDHTIFVENPEDNREYEDDSQDSYEVDKEKSGKNVNMDRECWDKDYEKGRTDEYVNAYSSIGPRKNLYSKLRSVNEPYPITKPIESLSHSRSKKNQPVADPQPSYLFTESSNSQIYHSRPTNLQSYSHPMSTKPQSFPKLPYRESNQISDGLKTTRSNITSDIFEREMEIPKKDSTMNQKQFGWSVAQQHGNILQKSDLIKQPLNQCSRDGIKAFESAAGGIVTMIVLKGFPMKKMMSSELVKLESAILNEMDKIPEGEFHPQFVEYTKKRGSLIIVSENRSAANWLQNVVGILEPWEGAQFKTFERGQEPIMWLCIHSGDPKASLNPQQLILVQDAIFEKVEEIVDGDFYPELLDCYKKPQLLALACNNRRTVDWLKETVQTLELWENARLVCVDPSELGEYKKFRMEIVPWDDPITILDRIERQNDNLCTGSWKVMYSKVVKGRQGVLVVAVKKSVLETLRGIDFRPFLNLSRVLMQEMEDYSLL